ncbi:MAG: hypothetical protein IJY92_07395 [Alphaproteobacteria bacterium]|nr:hypothetical protein [Alphaproteobacteria bacterium]
MHKDNEFYFFKKAENTYNNWHKGGCGCGCLTGLIVLGSIIASIIVPSKTFDKLGEEWQKPNEKAQKVIKTKRAYHEVQKNGVRQHN